MPYRSVLFDWRGTLYYELSTEEWLRAGASALGRKYTALELSSMASRLEDSTTVPDVVSAQLRADWSPDLNRDAAMVWFRATGLDDELAVAVWSKDRKPGTSLPYPDTHVVLRALKDRGVQVAVVSDIHYELAPHFAAHGLDAYVDFYVLSYKLGCQKPDSRMFQAALDGLSTSAQDTLMVGDRASRDAGGVVLGITTLILPPVPNGAERGLDVVLRMI